MVALRQKISPGFSIYLDLVRLAAALIVMLAHAEVSALVGLPKLFLDLAPLAVIVFFVLSGYIIEATTDRSLGLRHYAIHRAARIYSVAIPAVLISLILSLAFASRATADLVNYEHTWLQWWRLPVVLSFQAEDWFTVVEVPWNGPFWSLHYEVTYYIFYAAMTFFEGRVRTLLVAAICLVAGPKILLLLPCWWIGAELARRQEIRWPSRRIAWGVLIGSHFLIIGLAASHLGNWMQRHLVGLDKDLSAFDHSTLFVTDYITAVLVAAGFVAARQLDFGPTSLLVRFGKPIRWAAGYTFSLYLLHRPLQTLASQYFRFDSDRVGQALAIQALILAVIVGVGTLTEKRTQSWRRLLDRLIPEGSHRSPTHQAA